MNRKIRPYKSNGHSSNNGSNSGHPRSNNQRFSRGRSSSSGRGNSPHQDGETGGGPDRKMLKRSYDMRDKYTNMARDAQSSGDRVLAEYYHQHVDHYFRMIRDIEAEIAEIEKERSDQRAQYRQQNGEENPDGSVDNNVPDANDAEEAPQSQQQPQQQSQPQQSQPQRTNNPRRQRTNHREQTVSAEPKGGFDHIPAFLGRPAVAEYDESAMPPSPPQDD